MKIKYFIISAFLLISFNMNAQNTFVRIELDVKKMLNPSCNLNMGDVDSNKVYAHLGLCTCFENTPFGPEYRDCNDPIQNQLFCTTQITPFQSRVWQHVVGSWGTTPQNDGIGLMNYEGDSIWSIEFIVEDYFSDLTQVQDTSMGNDSSIAYQQGLTPYTIGVVFRSLDGFYTGRDNGCNDIFITGLTSGNPQVIQSTDLSSFDAISVETSSLSNNEISLFRNLQIFPNPTSDYSYIRFTLDEKQKAIINLIDINGRKITTLINKELNSGNHEIYWDGLVNGQKIESGIYLIEINLNEERHSEHIIVN